MKMIVVLTTICIISAFLLGLTYSMTVDKIKYQEEMIEKNALKSVLPFAVDFSKEGDGYYKGLNAMGEVVGYAFIGGGKGYSSVISVMVGIDTERKIQGIKILSQQETPGLGGRVEEPWFQKQFSEKGLDAIDTITGATISSRAVIAVVTEVCEKGVS